MALNPHHPGIYRIASVVDHYRRRDYEGALAILDSANVTSYPHAVLTRAAIYAQLGRQQEASVRVAMPPHAFRNSSSASTSEFDKWLTPDVAEHLREGILNARDATILEGRNECRTETGQTRRSTSNAESEFG